MMLIEEIVDEVDGVYLVIANDNGRDDDAEVDAV